MLYWTVAVADILLGAWQVLPSPFEAVLSGYDDVPRSSLDRVSSSCAATPYGACPMLPALLMC